MQKCVVDSTLAVLEENERYKLNVVVIQFGLSFGHCNTRARSLEQFRIRIKILYRRDFI